jgi:cytochrome c oxidase assembly protein subunit 15
VPGLEKKALMGYRHIFGVAWVQAVLGIVTLVTVVPVSLGSLHQAGALTLWSFALYAQHALRYVK